MTVTRREAMLMASSAALGSPVDLATSGGEVVHGTVFHDRSGEGVRRIGDPGVPEVLVSNGIDVVATDRDGRWQLPASPDGALFVIKPSDWTTPVRANGLPDFTRIARSPGRPLDLALRPAGEARRFEVALLADTQPQNPRELGYLRDCILGRVSEMGAAFAINHGDVVFDDLELYARYLELVRATGMPWHHCPGNHDMDWKATSPERGFDTWRQVFGPCHYAFQHGGATFILLNNIDPLPSGERSPGGYGYRGRIGRDQLAFVRNLLAHVRRDALVVVSMHIPLVGFETPNEPSAFTLDRRELLELLSGRPNTLSLAGHTHTTEHHYLGSEQGFSGPGLHHHHVLTAACGGWWSGPYDACGLPVADSRDGTPKGFHVLTIDGGSYTTRFVPVGHAGDANARISIEGRRHVSDAADMLASTRARIAGAVTSAEQQHAMLVVNVFDGGPRTTVECELTGCGSGPIRAVMQRRDMPDPYISEAYCRYKPDLKPWLEPAVSSHVWTAPLPIGLKAGSWRARVHVKDEYGRASSSTLLFEIVP